VITIIEKEYSIKDTQRKKRFKKIFLYIKSFFPLILSHHPNCSHFSNHTINIKSVRLCIGCFVGYPTAIVGILIIGFFNLQNIIPREILLIFGITFISTFILSILNLTKIKIVKIIQKFLIGLGSALLFWGIIKLSNNISLNFFIAFTTLTILLVLLNVYHTYGFYRTCIKCETPLDWASCEGLAQIREKLIKYDLNNVFESFSEVSEKILLKKEKKEKKSIS